MADAIPTYPNFAGKHAHDSFITPADVVAYRRRTGLAEEAPAPAGIVLCYQRWLYEHVLAAEGLERPPGRGPRGAVTLARTGHRVGVVGGFGIGAPAAAMALEDHAALGTTRFLSIGTAGSLQADCPVGHTVLCDRAIRDEGVSHHYLAPGRHARPSPALTVELTGELQARDVAFAEGCSWTIDTPYRETVEEARHYQAEGVLCVEMEAAALFAVGEYRGIEVAAAFVISDSLADLVWDPQFHSDATVSALHALYEAAVTVLERGA